jgi:F-type H+-transporting ATPase subunit b
MNVIFLDASSLMTPDPGLAFWTLIIFVILWLILGKFAFKPIAKALSDRTQTIQDSLDQAKKAREEMELLAAKNEDLLKQAKEERNKMLHEAKDASARIIEEAREKAKEEYS